MPAPFCPLPVRQQDARIQVNSASFRFGEACHAAGLRVRNHAHRDPSVTLVREGSLTETYPRSRVEKCDPRSILFRPAGERHCDLMGTTGCVTVNIEIVALQQPSTNLASIERLFEMPTQTSHSRLAMVAQQIHGELYTRDTARSLVLEGLALELLGIASRVMTSERGERVAPRWLLMVRDVLHDRFHENVRMTELADVAGVHPVYLARIFRLHYGITPGAYLRRVRLEWALRQLGAESGMSLSEIAITAGFADQSHFTRAFTRHFGSSPGRMRRHVGELSSIAHDHRGDR